MRLNKPIFVVGSPRSGTSVLTWCLGQHSNIFVQEESNWIGRLGLQLELAYRTGTARGERSQLSALDVQRADFLAHFGDSINDLIIGHRGKFEARIAAKVKKRMEAHEPSPPTASPLFRVTRSKDDPKGRWVDGTPEYSFYIHPLHQVFPAARFIHIVRDVTAVVHSMLNFHNTGAAPLVADISQAYQEWLQAVRSCSLAERAYGSEIIRRVSYAKLIDQPEETVSRLLTFLGEEFEPGCLEPLRKRINSSNVPTDFGPLEPANLTFVTEAKALSRELLNNPQPSAPDPEAAAEIDRLFHDRADYLARAVS